MLLNYFLLSLSVSIDSLGIGITYGIKNTKIDKSSLVILSSISFLLTTLSIFLGYYLSMLISPTIATFFGSSFLILLGFYNIYKIYNNTNYNFDSNNSNSIDKKESFILGIALSVDSVYIGIGCGIIGLNSIIFPVLVTTFQLLFLNCGNILSKKIINRFNFPDKYLSFLSNIVLILIGIIRLLP